MKVVYLAGPYRAATPRKIVENIRYAEMWALTLWKLGAAVLCPHLNTALFDGECPDSVWLEGDLEMLRRCDAVCLLPGWEGSSGTRAEAIEAQKRGIPVFRLDEALDPLHEFLGVPHAA